MPTRLLSAVLLVVIVFAGLSGSAVHAQSPLVCVDAGHGGSDTGTSGGGIIEKDLNLDVAFALGSNLIGGGYGVAYTRTTDVGLSNTERAQICNAAGATILISVHHNGSSDINTDYTTALYQKRIDRDLASIISAHVARATSGWDRGIMQFASSVLIKSDMPATISEGYFLTSTAEQQKLGEYQSDAYWTYVGVEAQALYNGVVAYLGSNDGGGETGEVPAAPTGVWAAVSSIQRGSATIDLGWSDNAMDETGYRVYRSTNGGAYELILNDLKVDTVSAQDQVKRNQTYQYCVAAFNEAGESTWGCSNLVTTS